MPAEARTTSPVWFAAEARNIGLDLSRAQIQAVEGYHAALYDANQRMNLTRVPEGDAWLRHYLDSVLFQDLIPSDATVLDLGTGPGLPAWPLAVMRPDLKVTAVDSNGKMLGFLRSLPLPNLEVVQGRAEEWDRREAFDVVTGRAVAPLSIQLEISAPFARLQGLVIPMRTPSDELPARAAEALGLSLRGVEIRPLSQTEVVRAFPVYKKARRTDPRFPRKWAEIKANPL